MTTPTVIADRYQIVRPIERGGMAEVLLAVDTRLDRSVAIKLLHDEYANNAGFLHRFEREARAAAGLNHPNMVQVYDYGSDGGSPYIVMEYVRGKTLRDLLREQGMPPPDRAAEVIADVAKALQFAHDNGIVHRDVKPANVMVDSEATVKVADLGIAQQPGDDAQLTQVGSVVGTAAYFSPEQAQGHFADARSDVYAMGCCLYELISGRPPFDGETPWAIAYKHVNEPPMPPSQVNPAAPRGLEAVVLKAMTKDPNGRYQSAAEMRADLMRFVHGEEPLAVAAMAAVATPAAAYAAAGSTSVQSAVAAPPPPVAAQPVGPPPAAPGGDPFAPVQHDVPEDETNRWPVILGVIGVVIAIAIGAFLLARALSGGGQVEVPDVRGREFGAAQSELEQLGFEVERRDIASDKIEVDRVIRTDPKAGEEADNGDTVVVFVSGGPADVEVPDVVGRQAEEARSILEEAGLKVRTETVQSDEPAGAVVAQNPPPGTKYQHGGEVALQVSAGPELVTVPNIEGLNESAAESVLRNTGFEVTNVPQESDQTKGTVITQVPASGAKAAKGSTVTITVSSGRPLTMPNVYGKLAIAARQQLEGMGLTVVVQQVPAQGTCALDTVCDQNPSADTRLQAGSQVTIYVGANLPTSTTTSSTTTTTKP